MNAYIYKYESPQVRSITLEAELSFLAGSGIGSNEELLDDLNDYSDFFE